MCLPFFNADMFAKCLTDMCWTTFAVPLFIIFQCNVGFERNCVAGVYFYTLQHNHNYLDSFAGTHHHHYYYHIIYSNFQLCHYLFSFVAVCHSLFAHSIYCILISSSSSCQPVLRQHSAIHNACCSAMRVCQPAACSPSF